ncbi:MAG: hypothetical protein GY719_21005 [bacterium]|nr:hypothetical protein [bacterium]
MTRRQAKKIIGEALDKGKTQKGQEWDVMQIVMILRDYEPLRQYLSWVRGQKWSKGQEWDVMQIAGHDEFLSSLGLTKKTVKKLKPKQLQALVVLDQRFNWKKF